MQSYLTTEDFEMKLSVVRAIANVSEAGVELLMNDAKSDSYPLNEMLTQIKSEIKV
ncbi:hypothetical protein [Pedobacter steynii]